MRVASILLLLPLAACGAGGHHEGIAASGAGATRSYPASGFTRVQLSTSDDVTIATGKQFAVTATGDAATLDRLKVEVVDGELRIGRKHQGGWNWGSHPGLKLRVTMPTLTAAAVSGSGTLAADRGAGDFQGSVSGSGDLRIGALDGGNTQFSIAGSGTLKASGKAHDLHASITGSGSIEAPGLTAETADVSVAGSGDLVATVTGKAAVSILGSGDVELRGGAQCTVNRLGAGEARCG